MMMIFFHVTCHVEPALKSKIQNGEFIELEKLLPRNKFNAMIAENTNP